MEKISKDVYLSWPWFTIGALESQKQMCAVQIQVASMSTALLALKTQ